MKHDDRKDDFWSLSIAFAIIVGGIWGMAMITKAMLVAVQ